MTKEQRLQLLGQGPIPRALYLLSYPAVLGLFSGALYSLVDTFFIGLLGQTAAVGASAVVFPIFIVISALGLGFGIGAASSVSRLLGAQREEDAQRVASTAFYSSLAAGLLLSVFGVIFIDPILIFFGATETILEHARVYGVLIIGGSVFRVLNMCMNNLIRSEGAASYSGRALILGSVLNMLLDPICMFLLGMGIRGAGAATILAQAAATLYLLRFYIKKEGVLTLSPRYFHPTLWIYRELLRIGIPTFIRQSLVSFSIALLNQAARSFGDASIAGVGIVTRLMAMIFMVNFGIGQGLQPLAGYNYGARNYRRVLASLKLAVGAATVYSSFIAVLFFLFAPHLIFVFSRDPEVISVGSRYLRISSLTVWMLGFQIVGSYLFQAIGKGRETAILAVSRQGFFFIPLVFLLPRQFGLNGLFFVQPGADFLATLLTGVLVAAYVIPLKKQLNNTSEDAHE